MAVKTITIDIEAYERLASLKKEGESFSRLIKRIVSTKRSTAADLMKNLPRIALSGETLDRLDEMVRERDLHRPDEGTGRGPEGSGHGKARISWRGIPER